MRKVVSYSNKECVVFHTIVPELPIDGSYANYILLKEEYKKLCDSPFGNSDKAVEKYKQLVFNTQFLEEMLEKHGELHCVYCGKEDLKIYYWWESKKRIDQATADHFYPKSIDSHLSMEKSNLRVCCHNCNTKKGSKIWEEKFPYPQK